VSREAVTPLFLFALSRSGSTLLQRMLGAHPEIATTSEPWLLLPLCDLLEHRFRTFSVYGHELAVNAVHEFAATLPEGEEALKQGVHDLVLSLYDQAAGPEARYFLDKTPAYSLICDQIVELFPEGRFVWLVRHPLAVVASLLETFAEGKWYLYRKHHELFTGLTMLHACHARDPERILKVNYEELLADPEAQMQRIYQHLGVAPEAGGWQQFAGVDLQGTMQDPTGTRAYRELSSQPLAKWHAAFANPFRQWWARRYLRWIGRERLAAMGYDLDRLLAELAAVPTSFEGMAGDMLRHAYGSWRIRWQSDVASMMRSRPKADWSVLH
jgi:hypothetical protein